MINAINSKTKNTFQLPFNVSWTPLTLQENEYHYTVHYTTKCCFFNEVSFPASASSGVVSGLQEGQQHQFSVAVSLNVKGTFLTNEGLKILRT